MYIVLQKTTKCNREDAKCDDENLLNVVRKTAKCENRRMQNVLSGKFPKRDEIAKRDYGKMQSVIRKISIT